MEIDKLLKTVVKAKTCLLQNKEKLQEKRVKFINLSKLHQPVPQSVSQLLTRYSPRSSPLLRTFSGLKKKTLLNFFNLFRRTTLKNFWQRWTDDLRRKHKKELNRRVSMFSSPQAKPKLCKTNSMRFEKTCKPKFSMKIVANRQKTIQKLESVICVVKQIRKLELQTMEISFQLVKKRSNGHCFAYLLRLLVKPYISESFQQVIQYYRIYRPLPKLSIARSDSISVAASPKKLLKCLVTQETSFNLNPTRFTYSPFIGPQLNLTSPSRHCSNHSQSFDLPNLSSVESINVSFDESRPVLDAEQFSQDSFHFFQGSEDLVEFEEKEESSDQGKSFKDPGQGVNSRYAVLASRESLPDKEEKLSPFVVDRKGSTWVPKCYNQFFEDEDFAKISYKDYEEKGQISTCVSIQSSLSQKPLKLKLGYVKHEECLKLKAFRVLQINLKSAKRTYKGLEMVSRLYSLKLSAIFQLF